MKYYPLQRLTDELNDLLKQGDQSPVVLTDAAEPRYIVLSIQNYPQWVRSLQALEDHAWGETAQQARQESVMLESEEFVAALQQILAQETVDDH